MRRKQTWPALRKQLLSHLICGCPNYIVSQPRRLCSSVLGQSIIFAFSISIATSIKSGCLLCVLRLLLFWTLLLSASLSQWNSDLCRSSRCGLQLFRGIYCHLFNGRRVVNRILSIGICVDKVLAEWEVTRLTGQTVWTVKQGAKCHTTTCQNPFSCHYNEILCFQMSLRGVLNPLAPSLSIWDFCHLCYGGFSSLAHTNAACKAKVNIP